MKRQSRNFGLNFEQEARVIDLASKGLALVPIVAKTGLHIENVRACLEHWDLNNAKEADYGAAS